MDRTDVLFGRSKKTASRLDEQEVEGADEALVDIDEEGEADAEGDDPDVDDDLDQWDRLDRSQDWRFDGPFDITEVDLSADEVERVDVGALIITPEDGMKVTLVADPETQAVMHVVVENAPQSALQLTLLAAPSTGDYCARARQQLIDQSTDATSIDMAPGPFGTELRRVLAVTNEEGHEGFAPLRDWFIGGPRWVLNARLIGQAALDSQGEGLAGEFEEFVRNIIVRRGDQAMVPGSIVPLTSGDQA
ncbi:MAG: DUF3710 domain-containing protein [Propionibacteriaceae bacterium]|nr:DUF3710 domain-containing protein [Propionibacteriaceae bacterium]